MGAPAAGVTLKDVRADRGDVIVQQIQQQNVYAAAEAATALHQVPAPPRDFTGREAELKELTAAVEAQGVTISGLQGLAGVGKTALALVLAEKLKPRYPDAQFFLDLKGVAGQKDAKAKPLTPAAAMAHVIRSYHPAAKLPESEAELSGLYRSVLEGQRALLLMDNAKDRAQMEPLMPPSSCLLLFTSRQHFSLPGLYAKDLEALPPEDARDLLLKIAPRINGQADTLAKLCGYLPLALRLAGSALAEHVDLAPSDYIKRLTNAQKRLELVDASLSLSYELLAPEMEKQFSALAVFPSTFDAAAAAAVWALEREAAQDALSGLVAYSLVQYEADVGETPLVPALGAYEGPGATAGIEGTTTRVAPTSRYRLHDLVRLFADARLGLIQRALAQRRHAEHFETVLRSANELYKAGKESLTEGLKLFDLEVENIKAGQAWAVAHAGQDQAAAKLSGDYPDAGANVLDLRQHPRERISWLEAPLAAARRLRDRGAEGAHLGNLGNAYTKLGETRRAIKCHEQALVIDREIGYRRGEGKDLGNLGIAYAALGETRRAIEYHEQYLAIAREIGDRLGEGNALGNLGNAYAVLGETPRAIEYYEKALVIDREIGDRRGEGTDLWNMSLALDQLGDRAQAIAYAEAALKIYEQIEDPAAEKVREQLATWKASRQ